MAKIQEEVVRNETDVSWKIVLKHMLQPFLELCCPDFAQHIDFDKGVQPLDKELHEIMPRSEVGKNFADLLFSIYTKHGQEQMILVHLEVKAHKDTEFAKRMFRYYYRILDKYQKPTESIAILIDKDIQWRPNFYQSKTYTNELYFKYHVVKLLDYTSHVSQLEELKNPFSFVFLTQLNLLKISHNEQNKRELKTSLLRRLLKSELDKKSI